MPARSTANFVTKVGGFGFGGWVCGRRRRCRSWGSAGFEPRAAAAGGRRGRVSPAAACRRRRRPCKPASTLASRSAPSSSQVVLNQLALAPVVLAVVFSWNLALTGEGGAIPTKIRRDLVPSMINGAGGGRREQPRPGRGVGGRPLRGLKASCARPPPPTAGWKFWVPAASINFYCIPLDKQGAPGCCRAPHGGLRGACSSQRPSRRAGAGPLNAAASPQRSGQPPSARRRAHPAPGPATPAPPPSALHVVLRRAVDGVPLARVRQRCRQSAAAAAAAPAAAEALVGPPAVLEVSGCPAPRAAGRRARRPEPRGAPPGALLSRLLPPREPNPPAASAAPPAGRGLARRCLCRRPPC
jgi:hypothetical protein